LVKPEDALAKMVYALELASGHARASPWAFAARGMQEYLGQGRGPAAQSGFHRPVPRSPRRPPGWPRGYFPRWHLVVASLRRREVCRAGRHRPAKLTNGASSLLPRRLARADVCPRRANVAALTSAVRRETARNAHADVISGLSPGSFGSATPCYRGQHQCGAIELRFGPAPGDHAARRAKRRVGGQQALLQPGIDGVAEEPAGARRARA